VQRVASIIGEVSAAAGEQSGGITQVNGAVSELDRMTQENAALVEEAAAASEAIVGQAHALNEMIARYKVAAAVAARRPADGPKRATSALIEARATSSRAISHTA